MPGMRRGGDNVVVVGSGAAGLAAALAAAHAGAEVTLLERADHVGGTTAISGGVAWIPANHLATAAGLGDTADDALRYLRAIGQGDYDDALVQVFVQEAAEVACSIEQHTRLRWSLLADWPDYHAGLPGGRTGGRSIWPEPLELAASVAGLVQTSPESPDVPAARGSDGRVTDAMVFRGPVRGRVLVGAMLEAVLERGVTVEVGVPVDGQLVGDGAVRGVRAAGVDRLGRVVLATGGFQHDTDLARTFLPGPPEVLAPMGTPGCTGDALRWTAGLGVTLGNMSEAWWMPALCVPGETLDGAPFYRPLHHERAQPGALMVDREGRRFVRRGAELRRRGPLDAALRRRVLRLPGGAVLARVRLGLPATHAGRTDRPERPGSRVDAQGGRHRRARRRARPPGGLARADRRPVQRGRGTRCRHPVRAW